LKALTPLSLRDRQRNLKVVNYTNC